MGSAALERAGALKYSSRPLLRALLHSLGQVQTGSKTERGREASARDKQGVGKLG